MLWACLGLCRAAVAALIRAIFELRAVEKHFDYYKSKIYRKTTEEARTVLNYIHTYLGSRIDRILRRETDNILRDKL